jgi:hypothetical protein
MSVVNVRVYDDGTTLAFVSQMVCNYNLANLDHGDAVTEPGWYVNGPDGERYDTEQEAIEAYGLEDQEYEYADD